MGWGGVGRGGVGRGGYVCSGVLSRKAAVSMLVPLPTSVKEALRRTGIPHKLSPKCSSSFTKCAM